MKKLCHTLIDQIFKGEIMAKMKVLKQEISTLQLDNQDYISITDIANAKDSEARAADIIKNWLRNRSTLEFIGTWEHLYNPDLKVVEFDHFRMSAGQHSFVLSPGKWVEKTNAIGIVVCCCGGGKIVVWVF